MARRPKHRNPRNEDEVAAVGKVVQQLARKNGWSVATLAFELKKFSDGHDVAKLDIELVKEDFRPANATLRTIVETGKIASDGIAKALFHFLKAEDPEALYAEINMKDETWVAATRGIFGHVPVATPSKISRYVGQYELYRPFHLDPRNYVLVEKLTIGGETPFECEIDCEFDYKGSVGGAVSNGRAVPHGPKLFLVLQVGNDRDANTVIFFDRRLNDTRGKAPLVSGLKGCMIATVGTYDDASAWPCYARRVSPGQQVTPRIIPRSAIDEIPERARHELARGAIYWRDSDFVRPYEGALTAEP